MKKLRQEWENYNKVDFLQEKKQKLSWLKNQLITSEYYVEEEFIKSRLFSDFEHLYHDTLTRELEYYNLSFEDFISRVKDTLDDIKAKLKDEIRLKNNEEIVLKLYMNGGFNLEDLVIDVFVVSTVSINDEIVKCQTEIEQLEKEIEILESKRSDRDKQLSEFGKKLITAIKK